MKALKALSLVLVVAIVLVLGYAMGRAETIRQAELIDATDHEYHISFDGEIHTYTFE